MTTAKRQKIRADEIEKLKQNILTNLPILSTREIRRHRIPYDKALTLELLEDGYEQTGNFIQELITLQKDICEKAGKDALVWYKPMLKDNRTLLDILYNGLKTAEQNYQIGQTIVEIDNLLKLSIYFSNLSEDWWWVSEQLFLICLNSVQNYCDDGNKMQALVYYIFGRFLLKQLNDIEKAQNHLTIARKLSNGQNWTAANILKIPQSNLFQESCNLLCECHLISAKQIIKHEPKTAYKMCTKALKRAIEAEDYNNEAECIFYLGLCDLEVEDPLNALQKFNKVLIMHYSSGNKIAVCETRIHLALANSKLDNMSEAKYHLHQLLDYSEKYEMKFYVGLSHRFLGELYLLRHIGTEAYTHLLQAVEIFHELNDFLNREISKNLAAIAKGQQLSRALIKLINLCSQDQKSYLENVIKLVKWKDSRIEFWTEKDIESDHLSKYLEEIGEVGNDVKYSKYAEEENLSLYSANTSQATTVTEQISNY